MNIPESQSKLGPSWPVCCRSHHLSRRVGLYDFQRYLSTSLVWFHDSVKLVIKERRYCIKVGALCAPFPYVPHSFLNPVSFREHGFKALIKGSPGLHFYFMIHSWPDQSPSWWEVQGITVNVRQDLQWNSPYSLPVPEFRHWKQSYQLKNLTLANAILAAADSLPWVLISALISHFSPWQARGKTINTFPWRYVSPNCGNTEEESKSISTHIQDGLSYR